MRFNSFAPIAVRLLCAPFILPVVTQSQTSAPITIQSSESRVLAGEVISLSFIVGAPAQPIAGLFGLSFELHYSAQQYVRPLTPEQARSGPFLEPDTYNFAKHEPQRNTVALAVSRKLGASGKDGYGEVLTYSFILSPITPVGTEVCFSLEHVAANDAAGNVIALATGPPLCLRVTELAIDAKPNPFTPNEDGSNDAVEFTREGGIPPAWQIVIMDREGRVVRRLLNGETKWNGRDQQQREALPGIYLYLIQSSEAVVKRGVLALVR